MKLRFVSMMSVCILACGSPAEKKKEPEKPYTVITGSRVLMQLPDGFTQASDMIGIKHPNGSRVMVMDLFSGNYYTNAADMTRENMERSGAVIYEFRETTAGGYPAKFVYAKSYPEGNAMMLVFGDSTFTVNMMASVTGNDTTAARALKKALLAVRYDKNIKVDPFARAFFTIDDSGSRFKLADYQAGMYIYSEGGVKKESYENDAANISITQLPDEGTVQEVADMMKASMIKYGYVKEKNTQDSLSTAYGQEMLQSLSYGRLNDAPILFFQRVFRKNGHIIVFTGIARQDFEKLLPEFRKLSSTIRMK